MILFTHIPKTAGTTIKYILRNNFGFHHVDAIKTQRPVFTAEDLAFAKKVFPGIEAISGHNLVDPFNNIREKDAQLITILRDPVLRCASHYQDEVLRGGVRLPFREWIKIEKNQDLSVNTIAGSNELEKAKHLLKEAYTFVGFTEYFDDSIRLMQLQLEKPLDLQYRRMITARDNQVKEKLLKDPESISLLKKYNGLDQQLYDFGLNEIFLPALKNYASALKNISIPPVKTNKRKEYQRLKSVRYNKYIYRQLIKLLGK